MLVEAGLIVALLIYSMLLASLWWVLLKKLQQSRWLTIALNNLAAKMPESVHARLAYYAATQTVDKSISQWLGIRIGQLMSLLLLVLIPVDSMLKIGSLAALVWYFMYQRAKRKQYVRRTLREWPNALDMAAMLMHSGLSFRATLHAFQSTPSDSAALRELSRVQRAQQSGYSLEQALDALSVRIAHPWIQLFVGAVKQAQSIGGELANTLQRQAEQCRQQQLLEAEKRAQEVSVKLMFPLIFCFFPVTMLLILGPVFIGFMNGGMT